jgi:SAM-dependent methyltransferase
LFADATFDLEALGEFAFASRKLPEYMHWRLQECQTCDLLYSTPTPPFEQLLKLYRTASFDSRKEAGQASETYGRYLARIAEKLRGRDGAIDIGTGEGAFLSVLQNAGFTKIVGFEPSSAAVAQAAPGVKPLIREEPFRAGLLDANSMQIVTCFQTIEHLPDPLGMCKEAWRLLQPGGAIFLVGHNRRAFSAKVLGHKSPIFDIEHLQIFSPSSLKNLLEGAGFTDCHVEPIWNRYSIAYWTRLFPLPGWAKRQCLNLLRWSRIGLLNLSLPAGNLAAFAYKRAG